MLGVKQIIFLEFVAGTDITEAVRTALYYCRDNDVEVTFDFNGVTLRIAYFENDSMVSQINFFIGRYKYGLQMAAQKEKEELKAKKHKIYKEGFMFFMLLCGFTSWVLWLVALNYWR